MGPLSFWGPRGAPKSPKGAPKQPKKILNIDKKKCYRMGFLKLHKSPNCFGIYQKELLWGGALEGLMPC